MKTNMDCDRCGGQEICCSQVVRVTQNEKQRLGLKQSVDFMNLGFTLCQFFDSGRCTVYARRPRACIDFNCCNPGQLHHNPEAPPEARLALEKSLQPKHWLAVTVQKRKEVADAAKEENEAIQSQEEILGLVSTE